MKNVWGEKHKTACDVRMRFSTHFSIFDGVAPSTFWDVIKNNSVHRHWRFGKNCSFHFQEKDEILSKANGMLHFVYWRRVTDISTDVFKHNPQYATLHDGIYYYKCSTCFRRFLRPSSGARNCIHIIGYLSSFFCFLPQFQLTQDSGKKQKKFDKYSMLCLQFWAPDDRRRNGLKHVEHL
jgi:hypothetical protein